MFQKLLPHLYGLSSLLADSPNLSNDISPLQSEIGNLFLKLHHQLLSGGDTLAPTPSLQEQSGEQDSVAVLCDGQAKPLASSSLFLRAPSPECKQSRKKSYSVF